MEAEIVGLSRVRLFEQGAGGERRLPGKLLKLFG